MPTQYVPVEIPDEQPKKKKFESWLGSKFNQDTSDLFEVSREDLLDTDDLVKVDMNRDILDGDPDGTLNSLTEVTEEDVMGDEVYGQSPLQSSYYQKKKKEAKQAQQLRRTYLPQPNTQMGRLSP